MHRRTAFSLAVSFSLASASAAQDRDIPRTPSGRPDLSGTYDAATLTPMERGEVFGGRVALTDDEAARLAEVVRQAKAFASRPSDPNRGAPPVGGDSSSGNAFWIEPGQSVSKVDGQWRTSILIDPPNGRYPPRVADAPPRRGERRQNDGTAYWLAAGLDAPGTLRQHGATTLRRTLPGHPVDLRRPNAALARQQSQTDRAARGHDHDSSRDDARRAHYPDER